MDTPPATPPHAPAPPPAAGTPPCWDSRTLLGDGREVLITHGDGSVYRLRVTAAGKLILTK